MPREPEGKRIKTCLKCDRMIPFEAVKCPFCKSDQKKLTERVCAHCSTPLPKKAYFCSVCGALSVITAPTPIPPSHQSASPEKDVTYYNVGIMIGCCLLLIIQAWIVVDYLIF